MHFYLEVNLSEPMELGFLNKPVCKLCFLVIWLGKALHPNNKCQTEFIAIILKLVALHTFTLFGENFSVGKTGTTSEMWLFCYMQ